MKRTLQQSERVKSVRKIFEEYGIGNVEQLEAWSGHELEELADGMTEEEFQILLDRLEELED